MEKKLPGYGQNYIIKNKQDIEKREHMEKRLAAVTGFVDNKLSYAKKPMRNVKKEMLDENRYAQIEKDNLLLLQRMHAVSNWCTFVFPNDHQTADKTNLTFTLSHLLPDFAQSTCI